MYTGVMNIIKAIESMRTRSGISSAELARRSGKAPQFVSDMKKRPDLQVVTACQLAEALDCELVLRAKGDGDGIIVTP